ncbi:MAG: hypothetical protein E7311_01845 [Clostridiales bacterium]|nr:hypothetical protein [Clostridiales bacterium]
MIQTMLKFKRLELRFKLLIITGILTIISSIIYWIWNPIFLTVSCTLFMCLVFYNLYITIKESAILRDRQENKQEEDCKNGVILRFTLGLGIPGIIMGLLVLWLYTFNM